MKRNLLASFRKLAAAASTSSRRFTRSAILALTLASMTLAANGQTLIDSFADGDFTASPVWSGDTANWTIAADSEVAAGAVGSQTLRLAFPTATVGTEHLRTPISTWGDSQEWGIWIGIRTQALTAANQRFVWLYANEADLESATVDGYRLQMGDDTGGDEIRLQRITDGAVAATVITSAGTNRNAITDYGFLVRVTRTSAGTWTLYTSTLGDTTGSGAIATDVPNSSNATVNQGSASDTTYTPSGIGYIGVAVLHSTGANAIVGTEFDQIYFTPTDEAPANHVTGFAAGTVANTTIQLNWTDSIGSPAPANYVIVAKTGAGTFATVVDGTPVANDSNLADNNAAQNVAFGAQTYTFTGLSAGTSYDFQIYPYVGSGGSINYKTDGVVPAVTQSTTGVACSPPATPTPTTGGTICAGGNLALFANTNIAIVSYAWSGPNGFSSTNENPVITNATTAASGTYNLVIEKPAGCFSTAGMVAATVNPTPSSTITASAGVCTVSTGNTASVPDAGGGSSYGWSIVNGSITAGAGTTTITYTAGASGTVDLSCAVTNSFGCYSTNSTNVTISAYPDATITAPASVCEGGAGFVASVASAGVGATYTWTISGGVISTGSTSNVITFRSTGGAITLGSAVTNSAGCGDTDSVPVTADPAPTKTAYVMSGGNYLQDFSDIEHWGNGFVCGTGSSPWNGVETNATGTVPDGVRTTTATTNFASGSSGGVQRGTGTIVLLATGTTDNTTAVAVDVFLDFTGRDAGTLSFDWASVNNSTGDRKGSLRVYTSTDGVTFTELTGAAVLDLVNNVLTSGSVTTVALPSSLDESSTARVRFYYCNGTGGATGSRPKVSIDNVAITSTPPLTPGVIAGLVLSNPKTKTDHTNATITVDGKINAQPPGIVNILVNAGQGFTAATITSNTATKITWTNTTVTLHTGTNEVFARGIDGAFTFGYSSKTNLVFLKVPDTLMIVTNGSGTVGGKTLNVPGGTQTPAHGALLDIGRTYTLEVIPSVGYLLSNIVVTTTTSTSVYNAPPAKEAQKGNKKFAFLMGTNTTVTVNFVTNRFVDSGGVYYGLYMEGTTAHESSGWFTVKTDSKLKFTGKLLQEGTTVAFSGTFNLAGVGTPKVGKNISRKLYLTDILTLGLQLDLGTGVNLSGTVQSTNWGGAATMDADKSIDVFKIPLTLPASITNAFAMVMAGSATPATLPGGDGYVLNGKGIDNTKGKFNAKGYTGEGPGVKLKTVTTGVFTNGSWPFYAQLYKDTVDKTHYHGAMIGWLTINDGVTGDIVWTKKSSAGPVTPGVPYSGGFTTMFSSGGGTLLSSPVTNGVPASNLPGLPGSGTLTIQDGGFVGSPTNKPFTYALGKVAVEGSKTNGIKAVIKTTAEAKGQIDLVPNKWVGVALQNAGTVRGAFTTGGATSGSVRLTP